MGLVGILLGLALLIGFAYRGWSVLLLAPAAALAPGGATTMDTTLPIIARTMGSEAALLAFASGATLTVLVPILVPLLIRL